VHCESLFIEIPTLSGKPLIIGIIYCHLSHALQPFQDEFVKLVTYLQNNNYDYFISGDYIINLYKYHENSNVSNYVDCLASCGCVSLINKPTRFSKNSKLSLLDHIYTNICDEKIIINTGITIFDISDHLPIFVNFNLHHPTHQISKPKFRCLKHFDPTIFVSDLSLKLNNLNPEVDDVNTLSDEFVNIFNDTLDTHAPYRYAYKEEQRSFKKPWVTKGILTSIAKKNALYRKQLTTTNPNIIRQYKTYRNKQNLQTKLL